jgi:hypothetical protein
LGAEGDEFFGGGAVADAAAGFDGESGAVVEEPADGGFGGTAGGVKAGGGLEEVRAGFAGGAAAEGGLFFIEGRGFENYLDEGVGAGGAGGLDDGGDVLAGGVEVQGEQSIQRDDHVDFAGTVADGGAGLEGLDRRGAGAQGEPDDGGDGHGVRAAIGAGLAEQLGGEGDPPAVDADGGELMTDGLGGEQADVGLGGFGFQEGVIDKARQIRHKRSPERFRIRVRTQWKIVPSGEVAEQVEWAGRGNLRMGIAIARGSAEAGNG